MIISRVSVQRPVFAIMISAAIIVVGWFSYRQLGLDLMPKVDVPVVNVSVSLPGASAEEIDTDTPAFEPKLPKSAASVSDK